MINPTNTTNHSYKKAPSWPTMGQAKGIISQYQFWKFYEEVVIESEAGSSDVPAGYMALPG